MKVWILTYELHYEGSIIQEVFESKVDANKRLMELNSMNSNPMSNYKLEDFKVVTRKKVVKGEEKE